MLNDKVPSKPCKYLSILNRGETVPISTSECCSCALLVSRDQLGFGEMKVELKTGEFVPLRESKLNVRNLVSPRTHTQHKFMLT